MQCMLLFMNRTRFKVTETVNAHCLKEIKSLAIEVEMDAWRKKQCLDPNEVLVRDGLPLSPEEYTTYLLDEAQELRYPIYLSTSERNNNRMRRFMREMMRGRVIMELTDDEHDIINQLMRERAERAYGTPQPTATSTSTVQTAPSTAQSNPNSPSDSYVILKDEESEDTMSPALEDNQQSSLADTGIETPEQQSSPQGGNWEAELINTGGSGLVGLSSSPGVDSSSSLQRS